MNANAIQLLEISILLAGPIPDIGGMGAFFMKHFLKKVHFFYLHLNRCHF